MQLLVVDESEKKAWRRSRRVLAAFLYRRGSRTFTGRLSQQGVEELVQKLKDIASKNSKIAVFRLAGNSEFELIARIGNTSEWGDEGWFAHRVRAAAPPVKSGYVAMLKVIRVLVRLSALFHDIGKANEQFQLKLRADTPSGERLRHELLSYLMLQKWAQDKVSPKTPLAWLDTLSKDPTALASMTKAAKIDLPANFDKWAQGSGESPTLIKDEAERLLASIAEGPEVLLSSLLWLVLTHHRQIRFEKDKKDSKRADDLFPSLSAQTNQHLSGQESNLLIVRDGTPWADSRWLKSVQSNAQTLSRLLTDNPGILTDIETNRNAWSHNLALVGRPTLVLADYIASAQKVSNPNACNNVLFANTIKGSCGTAELADTLTEHLLKARHAVDPVFSLISGGQSQLPSFSLERAPILLPNAPVPERFTWQREAAMKISSHPGITEKPFFGMIVSGTGAGKTVAGPKLLGAASGDSIRYTCGLGLRSLTLQTGRAYRELLGIPKDDVLTVVGDALYAKLAATGVADKAKETEQEHSGSESLAIDDDVTFDQETVYRGQLQQVLRLDKETLSSVLRSSKTLAMTEVPILTCTVDHLMRASVMDSGSDALMSMRLSSADLILDEIDNYGLEDLQALGRLVHAAGCYGRRVILMSATVSETALMSLHTAWLEGIRDSQFRTGSTAEPVLAIVSNYVPTVIHEGLSAEASEQVVKSYISDVHQKTVAGALKNRALRLHIPRDASLTQAFDVLLAQARAFSKQHFTIDPATGKRLSAGFVRFNKVRTARQFARYLHEAAVCPPGESLRTQCYHRRTPMLLMSLVEKMLNKLLSRQQEQAIFAHPEISDWIRAEPAADEYLLIVSTTSIQETGRDHDYDWAITEPWSTRSLIQLAGRVLRHRNKAISTPNVALLTTELQELEMTQAQRSSGRPRNALELSREPLGPISATASQKTFDRLTCPSHAQFEAEWRGILKGSLAADVQFPIGGRDDRTLWFPETLFSRGIHAGACLSMGASENAILPNLEHFAQSRRMAPVTPKSGRMSLPNIWGNMPRVEGDSRSADRCELLWGRHAGLVAFRRQSAQMIQLTLNPKRAFKEIMVVARTREGALTLCSRVADDWTGGTTLRNPHRSLLRLDLISADEAKAELGAAGATSGISEMLAHSFEVYMDADHQLTGFVDYDPLLGADTRASTL